MTKTHEGFLRALAESIDPVLLIAKYLVCRGRTVTVNGMKFSPAHRDWEQYADAGDLILEPYGQMLGGRIEVKRYQHDFTCREDWPFRDLLVCARHSYDRADPKPTTYVYLNKALTHFGLLKTETFDHWVVRPCHDPRRPEVPPQDTYYCPSRFMTFHELTFPNLETQNA